MVVVLVKPFEELPAKGPGIRSAARRARWHCRLARETPMAPLIPLSRSAAQQRANGPDTRWAQNLSALAAGRRTKAKDFRETFTSLKT